MLFSNSSSGRTAKKPLHCLQTSRDKIHSSHKITPDMSHLSTTNPCMNHEDQNNNRVGWIPKKIDTKTHTILMFLMVNLWCQPMIVPYTHDD